MLKGAKDAPPLIHGVIITTADGSVEKVRCSRRGRDCSESSK